MKDNKLADLSIDFAVEILKMCGSIKGHYSLPKQFERSEKSIGVNIHESKYAATNGKSSIYESTI